MDELLSEKEQIELIRDWWKENGTYVIAGILIGVGGIFGFNQWKSSQIDTQLEASTLFEAIAEEVAEDRLEPAEALAADMYAEYPQTIYADQTRLAMARLYMDQGRDQDAAEALRRLVDEGGDVNMQLIARLRLAKILLYQGQPEEVLVLLDGYTDSGFAARFQEALGDAHVALGNYREAEIAYLAALADPRASQLIDSALVQMKISDLPDVLTEDGGTTDVDAQDGSGEALDEAVPAEPADESGPAEAADEPAPVEDAVEQEPVE